MKKVIAIVLALSICFSLCACGKSKAATECENLIMAIGEVSADSGEAIDAAEKAYNALSSEEKDSISESASILNAAMEQYAILLEEAQKKYIFELSKEAYNEITHAYSIIHKFGADVYEAWHLGATQPRNVQTMGIAFLGNDLNLSEDELKGGLGYFQAYIEDKNWDELTEEERKEYIDAGDSFLKGVSNANVLQTSIYAIPFSYIVNGKTEEAQTALNNAKNIMRELSENYSDYEHYPNLKGYYTTAAAYFELCQNPKGTFVMLETTINDYMNEIRDYSSDLDFVFGE
jgi:hypothetical protein